MEKLKAVIKLLRPKHYIKNVLIFAPLVFNKSLFDTRYFKTIILGFISFCLVASSIYIINDIKDVEKDRRHPKKKNRPIASGKVSIHEAMVFFALLFAIAISINIAISSYKGLAVLLIYFVVNIIYSVFGGKDVPILDIVILVSGFALRVLYGAVITNIDISAWLYFTVIVGSFYMGLGKRRNELMKQPEKGGGTRKVLNFYTFSFLDKNMYMFAGLLIAFYSLWTMSTENNYLIWTVPIVIVILMKYSLDIEGESDADPVEVLYGDKTLIAMSFIYAVVLIGTIYFI